MGSLYRRQPPRFRAASPSHVVREPPGPVLVLSVADSLDTNTAAGRLVLNVMTSVAQWEREAIGERTRDALRLKQTKSERVGTVPFGSRVAADGVHLE